MVSLGLSSVPARTACGKTGNSRRTSPSANESEKKRPNLARARLAVLRSPIHGRTDRDPFKFCTALPPPLPIIPSPIWSARTSPASRNPDNSVAGQSSDTANIRLNRSFPTGQVPIWPRRHFFESVAICTHCQMPQRPGVADCRSCRHRTAYRPVRGCTTESDGIAWIGGPSACGDGELANRTSQIWLLNWGNSRLMAPVHLTFGRSEPSSGSPARLANSVDGV